MKIGILTGGGDCPGLNSVIYGVLLKSYREKYSVWGIEKGWKGFLENQAEELNIQKLEGLHKEGGTYIFTSRTNPFSELKNIQDEEEKGKKRDEIISNMRSCFKKLDLDVLIAIGGDDTLGVASQLYKYGNLNVIGVPKTIDNDLSGTDYTFGFWSAVQLASNSMDNIVTTARSHQRIFVVQVMGRDAGWLTIASGISAGAHIILIPEKPFDFEKEIVSKLQQRAKNGKNYHIIACAEGAVPTQESLDRDFKTITQETIDHLPKDSFGNPLLNKLNMSKIIVKELELRKDLAKVFESNGFEYDVRDVILGHTMRAGTPNAFDRILGLRLGMKAVDLIKNNDYGKMVCLRGENIEATPLTEGAQKKLIPMDKDSDWVELMELITQVKK
jgi:6-phosphofructokinase 1